MTLQNEFSAGAISIFLLGLRCHARKEEGKKGRWNHGRTGFHRGGSQNIVLWCWGNRVSA